MNQWQVIYKYRVCDRYLSTGHRWRECQSKTIQCPKCYTFHHSSIECRPKERISKRHNNQAHLNSQRPPNVNGFTLFTRWFSRTCPVVLHYPKFKRSMEGLAIIDDQATHTLFSSRVTDDLEIEDIDISSTNLTSTTIHGTSQPCKNMNQ